MRRNPLGEALERVRAVREGVEDVLDACAGLPSTSVRVTGGLRAVGDEVDALQSLWPQLEGVLAAAEGAGAKVDKVKQQQQQQQDEKGSGAQGDEETGRASVGAAALRDQVAASLPSLEPTTKRPRLAAGSARWQYADRLPGVVDAVRAAAPGLQVELMNSFANTRAHHPRQADEVRVLCPGVFCASVAIAGGGRPEPVRVLVDAAEAAPDVHAWAASPHQCFQRITALAARASAHYLRAAAARQMLGRDAAAAGPAKAGGSGSAAGAAGLDALERLLLWLATYSDLFSRPCSATGQLLCWEPGSEVPLPPVVRPFKLSREQLKAAARDPSLRCAYHAHAAPREALLLDVPGGGAAADEDGGGPGGAAPLLLGD